MTELYTRMLFLFEVSFVCVHIQIDMCQVCDIINDSMVLHPLRYSFCLARSVLQKVSLEFYIDVHAHSTMMNGFMYGNVFEEEERVQRQAVFPRLLCHNAPDFSLVSPRMYWI